MKSNIKKPVKDAIMIEHVYRQFHRELLSYVRTKIRSREDAEDLLQNVFAKIASNADFFAETDRIRNLLFTITKHAVVDYYRVNARRKGVRLDEAMTDDAFRDEAVDETQGLDHCMAAMINRLPRAYRHIIEDAEIRGVSQKDLAERYHMAYPSMRSRVQRGRKRLKQLFHECCHILADRRGNILEAHEKSRNESPCRGSETMVPKCII